MYAYISIHIVYRKHMIQYPLTLSMEFHNSQFPTRFNNYMTFHRDRIVLDLLSIISSLHIV